MSDPGGRGGRTGSRALAWPGRFGLSWSAPAVGAGALLGGLFTREMEARSLFNWLPVAMGLGVLAFFAADREPMLPVVLAIWCGACIVTVCLRRVNVWFQLSLAVATALTGFVCAALRTEAVRAPLIERTVVTRMTAIVESAEEGVTRNRLVLRPLTAERLEAEALPAKVRISQRGPLNVQAGDAVSLTARLLPPPHPVLPGGYDFARDAYFKQIGAVGSVAGKITVTASPAELPFWFGLSAAIDRARNDLTTRIAMLIGGQEGALTAAMITGKRGLIEEMRNADMRAAGIYHIVSISGLHMVLAAGIFLWVVRLAFALSGPLTAHWPTKKLAAGIAMLGATAYCIFSGSDVATVRSLIMTLCILGAVLFDRPALSMRNLAMSALLVLAAEPEELLGPSFQMSFAAVAALIAGSRLLRPGAGDGRHHSIAGRLLRGLVFWIAASVGTTLLATAATSPFAAFHFHQFSPYGILGNAVAIPVMEILVMPASILGVALVPFGLDAPIWWLTGKGAAGVLAVARWIAEIPGARLSVPGLDMPAILLFSGGFMLLVLLASRLRYLGLPLLVAASAVAALPQVPDLWIDRRGDAVAVKGIDGQLQVFGPGVSAFMLSNWLPAAGDERVAGDPSLRGAARCDGQGCTAQMADGRWLALVREPPAFEEDCRRAAVIVTPLVAPAWCQPALALIDYRFLARHGATLATLQGGKLSFDTSRAESMNRPWWPAFKPFRPRTPEKPGASLNSAGSD